jgi:D-3-phosphoglycerate dehydrogenase / 2-oxoglutarate reductase
MKAVIVGPFDPESLIGLQDIADVVHITEVNRERVLPFLADARVLISRRLVLDAALLDAAPLLQLVVKPGSGVDEIDVDELARRKIRLEHTRGENAPAVAELTIGLIVALVRKIVEQSVSLKTHRRWVRSHGMELYGKTLGIIGLGLVGSRVARIAQAMGMLVIGYDPYLRPDASPAPLVSFDDVLRRSDIITLHAPLTDETRELFGSKTLREMKPGAYLVNTSRGEIVNEAAILSTLESGHLAGYAADVLAGEGPGMEVTSRLLECPSVLLTPHLGAWTADTERRVCRLVVTTVRSWLRTVGDT